MAQSESNVLFRATEIKILKDGRLGLRDRRVSEKSFSKNLNTILILSRFELTSKDEEVNDNSLTDWFNQREEEPC